MFLLYLRYSIYTKWVQKRERCRTRLAQQKAGASLLEFKIQRKKVNVSSRVIGAMPKTMKWRCVELVFCGGDNPERAGKHVACRQWSA